MKSNEQKKSIPKTFPRERSSWAGSDRVRVCGVRLLAADAKGAFLVVSDVSRVKGLKLQIRVEPRARLFLSYPYGSFFVFEVI